MDNADTYLCVFEALKAAGWANDVAVDIQWIGAEKIEKVAESDLDTLFAGFDGIVVPGGWGSRGVEGKIQAAWYALTHDLPYLGLCYGLQMSVIAAARHHGLLEAHTTEVNPDTPDPVITIMEGQQGKESTGGTLRLGNYDCELIPGSLAAKTYKAIKIVERHRHRWECNPSYVGQYESWGIRAVGRNPGTDLVEVIEGINHPYFLASQFHPEFKSRPNRVHPMFNGFIAAAASIAKKSEMR
jgi:CTP synthase